MKTRFYLIVLLGIANRLFAHNISPDWSQNAALSPGENRENIFAYEKDQWDKTIQRGQLHALIYPVTPTLRIPYQPLKYYFALAPDNFFKKKIHEYLKVKSGFKNLDELYAFVGLHPYPLENEKGVYRVPYPQGIRPQDAMGATLQTDELGTGLTFSCAACHAGNLFGKNVLGLTNRFPRGNDLFIMGKTYLPLIPSWLYQQETQATDGETKMFEDIKKRVQSIDGKIPLHRSIDTSFAQVALSLSHRAKDEWAEFSAWFSQFPSANKLSEHRADSKPAVWWNLKYKTRWLSDGSIVSGNPVYTNILWNEIGRGADLKVLNEWMMNNQDKIDELTTAIFASRPPRFLDFYDVSHFDLKKIKHGQNLFLQHCLQCHGEYKKDWDKSLDTIDVYYHAQTPVMNVGTDPGRYQGMNFLAKDLNRLKISQNFNILVVPQKGYVPPPLVGIWARWPYLHNSSVKSLCELLLPVNKRSKKFYTGEANDPIKDFDRECNGYPSGQQVPISWIQDQDSLFDTSIKGMGNEGHSFDFYQNFTSEDRSSLVQFLQTL
jgi:mono/diheme cytochrome c family protein